MSKSENIDDNKSKKNNKSRNINELIKLVVANHKKNIKTFTTTELVKVLRKLSDTYYNTGETLVSDEVYDDIRDLLEEKDKEHPYLDEVGATIKGTKNKVKLPFEMGSLTKIKPDTKALEKWTVKYEGPYVISDKLDGVSVQLYKNNDGKTFLYSRGESTIGQDISHLIKYVVNNESIDKLKNGSSVRGELVISKKNFEKISNYMKNARNAVAGLVNSKTIDVKIAKLTDMVTYAILYPKIKQSEQKKMLQKCNFNVVPFSIVDKITEKYLKEQLIKRRKESIYEIDGIVCIDDSKIYPLSGGHPEHAFAFKMVFDDQIANTKVVGIEWGISMDGYIKPRVKIEPVKLLGTTVTYATGFNAKFIVDNKLGKGSEIKIIRSGDVIPYIKEILKDSTLGKAEMPSYKYKWNETKVDIILDDDDEDAKKSQTKKILLHFFSIIGVKYFSEGLLVKFIDIGLDTIPKILKAKRKYFNGLEGVGDKLLNKIYDEFDRALNEVDLPTFMGASHKFGRGMGVKKLEEVITMYPNILNTNWKMDEIIDNIKKVPGFAEKTANLFAKNFKKFKKFYKEIANIIDLSRFTNIIVDKSNKSDTDKKIFDGMKFVFTGKRNDEIETFVKNNGGKISDSVSGNTSMLIHADDTDKSSNKFKKISDKTIVISHSKFKKKYY